MDYMSRRLKNKYMHSTEHLGKSVNKDNKKNKHAYKDK